MTLHKRYFYTNIKTSIGVISPSMGGIRERFKKELTRLANVFTSDHIASVKRLGLPAEFTGLRPKDINEFHIFNLN